MIFPRFFLFFINFHDFCVQKTNDFIVRMGTTHNQGYMLVSRTLVHILYFLVGNDYARPQQFEIGGVQITSICPLSRLKCPLQDFPVTVKILK